MLVRPWLLIERSGWDRDVVSSRIIGMNVKESKRESGTTTKREFNDERAVGTTNVW